MMKQRLEPNFPPELVKEYVHDALNWKLFPKDTTPEGGPEYSEIQQAVMCAIGFKAIKLNWGGITSRFVAEHETLRRLAVDNSLCPVEDMICLYSALMARKKPMPYPETRDVYRYFYLISGRRGEFNEEYATELAYELTELLNNMSEDDLDDELTEVKNNESSKH